MIMLASSVVSVISAEELTAVTDRDQHADDEKVQNERIRVVGRPKSDVWREEAKENHSVDHGERRRAGDVGSAAKRQAMAGPWCMAMPAARKRCRPLD